MSISSICQTCLGEAFIAVISGFHLAEQQSLTKPGGVRLRLPDLSESQMLLCFSPWSKPSEGRFTLNLGKQRGLTVDTDSSQVPQPTYSWKWVGVSIPQKVGNFSLRPSSTAIWQRSRLRGCLLSFYGRWLSLTPTLNFHISTSAV